MKEQMIFHWYHVPGTADRTDDLNTLLRQGWRIAGGLTPAINQDTEYKMRACALVILEKDL